MKKRGLILPLLVIIITAFLVLPVIGYTSNEDEIMSECNLKDYLEDCARIVIGTDVLCIRCTTEEVISLSTCLDIWHSECLDDNDCGSGEECDTSQDKCVTAGDGNGDGNGVADDDEYRGDGWCLENWQCTQWSACLGNKKTRTCEDFNNCQNDPPFIDKPAEEMLCEPPKIPTCTDGIKNQGEEGVDCGGPCELCATCFDKIQNCHDAACEEGIDCGGPCMPCSLERASRKPLFWVIFITVILVIIILMLGLWYWKLRKGAEDIGEQVKQFTKKPPSPPVQPSSMLRI